MQPPEPVDSEWTGWVSASATHNWVEQDPLVDWLNLYGKQAGFQTDHDLPGYDSRFDSSHSC